MSSSSRRQSAPATAVGHEPPPAAGPFAYGVGLRGVAGHLPELMVGPWPGDWPAVDLTHRVGRSDLARPALTQESARLPLGESATLLVERSVGRAVIVSELPPSRDALLHPGTSLLGGVFAHWAGGTALHAGAIVLGGTAWGILGARERGKSTVLARFAQRGVTVIADDTLVVRSGIAFSGPRVIYLRSDAPARLGLGAAGCETARDGARRRFVLGPAPPSVALAGWIILRPGPEIGVTPLSPAQRLDVLIRFRNLGFVSPPPQQLLDLVSLPGFELRHPRRWELLDLVCDRVDRLAQGDAAAATQPNASG